MLPVWNYKTKKKTDLSRLEEVKRDPFQSCSLYEVEQPKISSTPLASSGKMGSVAARVSFSPPLIREDYYIINRALHLSRTASHLANVGGKVCQWSVGQSTKDLWKYIIGGVLPLKQLRSAFKTQSPAGHLRQTPSPAPRASHNEHLQYCTLSNRQFRAFFYGSWLSESWLEPRLLQRRGLNVNKVNVRWNCSSASDAQPTTAIRAWACNSLPPIVCESRVLLAQPIVCRNYTDSCNASTWATLISLASLTAFVWLLLHKHSRNPPPTTCSIPPPPNTFRFTGHVWPQLEWNWGETGFFCCCLFLGLLFPLQRSLGFLLPVTRMSQHAISDGI